MLRQKLYLVSYKLHQVSVLFILPLVRVNVSTFNIQVCLMHMNMKWTAVLNPGQTHADVSDHLVYALIKELQFRHPQLPIEHSLLVIHGQLMDGSRLV